MQASDRFNINSQLEHLQAKYVGTGHADMNRFEWAVNIQRDSYASYVGHYPIMAYFAIAENESVGRERYNFMQDSILISKEYIHSQPTTSKEASTNPHSQALLAELSRYTLVLKALASGVVEHNHQFKLKETKEQTGGAH